MRNSLASQQKVNACLPVDNSSFNLTLFSETSYLNSPYFNFAGVDATTIIASFAINYQLEIGTSGSTYDGINFQYSLNDNATWTTIGNASDPNWYNAAKINILGQTGNSRHFYTL